MTSGYVLRYNDYFIRVLEEDEFENLIELIFLEEFELEESDIINDIELAKSELDTILKYGNNFYSFGFLFENYNYNEVILEKYTLVD